MELPAYNERLPIVGSMSLALSLLHHRLNLLRHLFGILGCQNNQIICSSLLRFDS